MPRQKVVDNVYIDLTPEEEAELDAMGEAADRDFTMLRSDRNARLSATDWTQIPDNSLTDDERIEYRTYRQALRDYPAQSDRVSTLPAWPDAPGEAEARAEAEAAIAAMEAAYAAENGLG